MISVKVLGRHLLAFLNHFLMLDVLLWLSTCDEDFGFLEAFGKRVFDSFGGIFLEKLSQPLPYTFLEVLFGVVLVLVLLLVDVLCYLLLDNIGFLRELISVDHLAKDADGVHEHQLYNDILIACPCVIHPKTQNMAHAA